MSRTTNSTEIESSTETWADQQDRQWLDLAKTSPSLLGAGGVPLVLAAAASGTGLPHAGLGTFFDMLGSLADHWPGGFAGFGFTLAAGAAAGIWWFKDQAGTGGTGAVVTRATKREGFLTKSEINEHLSFEAMYANIARLRPSLARIPARQLTPTELGSLIGRDVFYKRAVYAPCEELTLLIGPPRVGKSAHIGGTILDVPGAAVVTTTRSDLYRHTAGARAKRGPVYVFNDSSAGIPSNLRWNPVRGCVDPDVAIRRARNILAASAKGEAMANVAFFDDHACRLLRALLMAADLIGGTLLDVQRWATSPARNTALQILSEHLDRVPAGWVEALGVLDSDERVRDSVLLTMVRSFEFLASPTAAAMVQPVDGEPVFDVPAFIQDRGTLYMMAEDKTHGGIAPLFSCLVGEVYEVGKAMAKSTYHGRLDPPLTLVLDEAATIVPLPLHIWSNDAGGNGITIHMGIQNQAQLYERWGLYAGQNIWSNNGKLIFGGLSVPAHLQEISDLCGEREEQVVSHTEDKDGNKTPHHSVRTVPVMSKDDVRKIRKLEGLYIFKNLSPVKVKFDPVWNRPEVKQASKAAKQQARELKKQMKTSMEAGHYPPMPQQSPVIPQQPGVPQAPAAGVDMNKRRSA